MPRVDRMAQAIEEFTRLEVALRRSDPQLLEEVWPDMLRLREAIFALGETQPREADALVAAARERGSQIITRAQQTAFRTLQTAIELRDRRNP